MIVRGLLGTLLALFALFATTVGAIELRLAGTEAMVALDPYAFSFEDASAAMGIDDIVRQASFTPNPDLLRPGFTHSAIWLKFDLANKSALPMTRWLEIQLGAHLQEATLFLQYNGEWRRVDAGSGMSFARRPVVAVNPVFPIGFQPGQTRTLYLRVASSLPVAVTPVLWDPLAFRAQESRTRLADGLMLGGLATMALVGMLLYSMFRDRAFLLNAVATLTYFLGELAAKGYSFMYLWPDASNWVMRGMPMYALLGVGLNLLFLRELLDTPRRFPRINVLLLSLLASEWILAPGILFGQPEFWTRLSFPQHFPITVAMTLVGGYAAIRGVHAARYYTVAYSILAVGSLIHGLWLAGVNVSGSFGAYALPLGMLLNNVFLLASVVDRIMAERRENEAAQNALLEERIARGVELEKAVQERTADLNAALIEKQKASQSQSLLVAYISHDLRAPLATIMNYVQRLARHDDPEVRRHQSTIERSATHQLELIDDLVEFARGELDHLELVPEPTYFHDWLDNIANQAEILAAEHGNRFFLDMGADLPPVVVFDAKRLRQVLLNLLANAAKFTTDGEVHLCLHATTLADGRIEIDFAVKDTGAGIPANDMERIFLPFERRKSQREGSGLGLSVARQLVRAMGGQLAATSILGVGSDFGFQLTLDTADEATVAQPAQTFEFPEPFGSGKSLLIADDNAASREYMAEVLGAADFDITTASDGAEALRSLTEHRFDLILVDQIMPDMGGWDVLRKLHERHSSEIPPIILCSAMAAQRPADFPEGIEFTGTLLKPVSADRLLSVVRNALRPENQPAPSLTPQHEMLAPLLALMDGGHISAIEQWSATLAATHPEYATFAKDVAQAAVAIDFDALNALTARRT